MESNRETIRKSMKIVTHPNTPIAGILGLADRFLNGEYDGDGSLKGCNYALYQGLSTIAMLAYFTGNF